MGQLQQQQQLQQIQEPTIVSQAASKTPLVKSQPTNAVPDESYCCTTTTSITPRQRPKPSLNAGIVNTQLGSSPQLKRALFPNAVVGHSPDVTNSFGNTSASVVESVDVRFQRASVSGGSPSSIEKAKLDELFPPYSGKFTVMSSKLPSAMETQRKSSTKIHSAFQNSKIHSKNRKVYLLSRAPRQEVKGTCTRFSRLSCHLRISQIFTDVTSATLRLLIGQFRFRVHVS